MLFKGRLLNNTASVDEIKRFGVWIKKDGNKEYFNSIKKIWHLYSNADLSESEINSAWLMFKKELDRDLSDSTETSIDIKNTKIVDFAKDPNNPLLNNQKPKKYLSLSNSKLGKFVKYAAMIVLIIGLYYIVKI